MENTINVRALIGESPCDVAAAIQDVIDSHPNHTLFFPDGEYVIERPLCTPADPHKSVSLRLADFAILRAAEGWSSEEAMVRLGGKDPFNTITIPGSNYGLEGGIIDGRGVARAVSIDSGRETYVRCLSIKNALCGIHIKHGANSNSSDADIYNVNIVGNDTPDSVGVVVEGSDNTFTNMRIAHVFVGVDLRSGGNMLRNIHPLFNIPGLTSEQYSETVGFLIDARSRHNWFDYCYSDQFATGFRTLRGNGNFVNCYCYWYSGKEKRHVAFESPVPFRGRINGLEIAGNAHPDAPIRFAENLFLSDDAVIDGVYLGETRLTAQELCD